MAYTCAVKRRRALGVITLSGSVDDNELVEAMRDLYSSEGWSRGFNILWDGTEIAELVIDQPGLDQIVEETGEFQTRIGPGKSAFVVRRQLDESMTKIILRMTRTPERERRLFRKTKDALDWLSE